MAIKLIFLSEFFEEFNSTLKKEESYRNRYVGFIASIPETYSLFNSEELKRMS